jgi:dTDP-4-amino-4,6-dideoxygalactose transaminase
MKMKNPIFVTKPFLPPLEEYIPFLEEMWASGELTNNGSFHKRLEIALCDYLGVEYISLFSNGTIALMVAIKALELKGEVITTPYSFVASSHAIAWNDIKPVFVDIDPITCNIDPEKIPDAITSQTSGILPVHVYGNPCDIQRIKEIAEVNNLKIIYDAAHAFGVKKNGQSVLVNGDLSVLSFHATKVFHTFEGGAIICNSPEMKKKIDDLKNFGFQSQIRVQGIGINGKMNEIQSAMGLLQLEYIDEIIEKRKILTQLYKKELEDIPGLRYFDKLAGIEYNYGYFPIFVSEKEYGKSRDSLYEYLSLNKMFGRRYFYPLINEFDEYINDSIKIPDDFPIAYKMSREVICLPLFPDLSSCVIERVGKMLRSFR